MFITGVRYTGSKVELSSVLNTFSSIVGYFPMCACLSYLNLIAYLKLQEKNEKSSYAFVIDCHD